MSDKNSIRLPFEQAAVNSNYENISKEVTSISRNMYNIESTIRTLKEEIVKEVCTELKGKIVDQWRKGTDKFYNDAKSIISDYSRPQSVASEISRSRSASRDYTPNKTMTKIMSGRSINLG